MIYIIVAVIASLNPGSYTFLFLNKKLFALFDKNSYKELYFSAVTI